MNAQLWAITSYFNPTGSRRRLANYHAFRAALAAPLLTIEWSPHGNFELASGDADALIQVAGGNLMWQKERLLNLGIARLPDSCRHVAWIDCDVVFDRNGWVSEVLRRLDESPLVQLFDRVAYLSPTPIDALASIREWRACRVDVTRPGCASLLRDLPEEALAAVIATDDPETIGRVPIRGMAWAARRELLTRHPLFDIWIVGGGDNAYLHAAIDRAHAIVKEHRLSRRHREHYLPRAETLALAVGGRVGFVPGTIYHLWHGELAHRRYRARHAILSDHEFDPGACLRPAHSGVWAWAQVPSTLPTAIGEYFRTRHEDGIDATVS